jgi:hypothetical protein
VGKVKHGKNFFILIFLSAIQVLNRQKRQKWSTKTLCNFQAVQKKISLGTTSVRYLVYYVTHVMILKEKGDFMFYAGMTPNLEQHVCHLLTLLIFCSGFLPHFSGLFSG